MSTGKLDTRWFHEKESYFPCMFMGILVEIMLLGWLLHYSSYTQSTAKWWSHWSHDVMALHQRVKIKKSTQKKCLDDALLQYSCFYALNRANWRDWACKVVRALLERRGILNASWTPFWLFSLFRVVVQ